MLDTPAPAIRGPALLSYDISLLQTERSHPTPYRPSPYPVTEHMDTEGYFPLGVMTSRKQSGCGSGVVANTPQQSFLHHSVLLGASQHLIQINNPLGWENGRFPWALQTKNAALVAATPFHRPRMHRSRQAILGKQTSGSQSLQPL